MLSYSWGMTSNKCGCEAQTPSLVPPIEASPLLIYSHFGRPDGGSETLAEQKVGRRVRDPRRTKGRTAGQRPSPNKRSDGGSETLVEQKVGRWGQRPSPNKHSEILYRIPTALPRNCRYNTYMEEQRVSFAFGNANYEDRRVTRDRVASCSLSMRRANRCFESLAG